MLSLKTTSRRRPLQQLKLAPGPRKTGSVTGSNVEKEVYFKIKKKGVAAKIHYWKR